MCAGTVEIEDSDVVERDDMRKMDVYIYTVSYPPRQLIEALIDIVKIR